jgi:hypothetical protein
VDQHGVWPLHRHLQAISDFPLPQDVKQLQQFLAKAVLDDPSYDQEGLALTGGDWFNTIKKAALESKLSEKELAARMKKQKFPSHPLKTKFF